MSDEAKAVAEAAKLGQEVTKASAGLGGYVAGVVGTIPHDLLGIVGGDWLSHVRTRNVARMQDKTTRLLESINQARISEPSPSLVLPLLQAAVDESREELQDLWAALLANAMIDGGKRIRREFFTTLKKLEPLDVKVLQVARKVSGSSRPDPIMKGIGNRLDEVYEALERGGEDRDYIALSCDNLARMECIALSGQPLIPTFGRLLLDACEVE